MSEVEGSSNMILKENIVFDFHRMGSLVKVKEEKEV